MITFLLMLTSIFSYVTDALNHQGIVIVAWLAALGDAEFRPGRVPAFNPAA